MLELYRNNMSVYAAGLRGARPKVHLAPRLRELLTAWRPLGQRELPA